MPATQHPNWLNWRRIIERNTLGQILDVRPLRPDPHLGGIDRPLRADTDALYLQPRVVASFDKIVVPQFRWWAPFQ